MTTEDDTSPTPHSEQGCPPRGFGKDVNDYLNHYVTVADAKAAAVVALNSVTIPYLVTYHFHCVGVVAVHWLALGLLALSLGTAVLSIIPRLPRGGKGLIFWEDIRDYKSAGKYEAALGSMTPSMIESEYARQNYLVSGVVHQKMRWVQWATLLFFLGAVALLVCMVGR